jgi:acetoin utilization deacetylase AcuC-like enzyme
VAAVTGRATETGHGAGAGATVNVPLPEGTHHDQWLAAFDEHIAPALRAHRPELILVSAGFDAHAADPLAGMELRTDTYAEIARRLDRLAGELCERRTAWALEGGYDLTALPDSVAATLHTLHQD